jgi:hypothetical protein
VLLAGTFAVVVHTTGQASEPTAIRAERVNLATGASDGVIDWDPMSVPVAVAPSGQRVLGRAAGFFPGTKNRVDLWELTPGSAAAAKHLVSFEPYRGRDKHDRDVEWAALVDNDRALTCSSKGELVLWKVGPAGAAGTTGATGSTGVTGVWRLQVEGPGRVALSPGRKHVACATAAGLAVVDVATGDTLGLVDAARSPTALDYTPDGRHVVGVGGPILSSWDLEKGTFGGDVGLPPAVPARSVASAGGGFVLVGGQHLFDLARRAVVWRYDGAAGGADAVAAHAGRCWAVVPDGPRRVLASAVLPHDGARKAAEALGPTGDAGLALKPGTSVTLEVAIDGTDEQRKAATDAITAQLRENRITVAAGQPVKVVARTEDGKTIEQTWQSFGGPGRFGPGRETQTTSVTEKITRVYVEVDGKIAWENRTVSVPSFVQRKEGQSIGEAVGAANKFNLAFLQSVRVPAYVPKPREPSEAGRSTWTTAGVRDAK